MGYWEEKKEYSGREFCNVCGKKLTNKNTKGKCVECEEIICNKCGKIKKGRVICSDCEEGGTEENDSIFGTGIECVYCGKKIKKSIAVCSSGMFGHWQNKFYRYLCKDCAKKCKECGRYFCPKHIKNHNCI